jgi:hypothetical protein
MKHTHLPNKKGEHMETGTKLQNHSTPDAEGVRQVTMWTLVGAFVMAVIVFAIYHKPIFAWISRITL